MDALKKFFILDTNIPLDDSDCIFRFGEHDVCIPIVVLEEIDRFKKGNESVNVNAREFTRKLESFSKDNSIVDGVPLGEGLGNLTIALGVEFPEKMNLSLKEDLPDHRILAIALNKQEQLKEQEVILVTNDCNLRVKARSLGILSESYRHQEVKERDMGKIFDCITNITPTDEEWDKMSALSEKGQTDFIPSDLFDYHPNRLIVLNSQSSMLVRAVAGGLQRVEGFGFLAGIKARNEGQRFSVDALLDKKIELVAITGKAGTGKTIITLAAALSQQAQYDEILVSRPVMEMSDKTLGFLPGDISEKLDPYMMPIYDNLDIIREYMGKKDPLSIREWATRHKIYVLALNYVRGRSLANRLLIVDEAQNLTPHEVKTIITRAAKGTKIVLLGDITQIDTQYRNERSNGLSYTIDKWKGHPEFVHVHLTKGERSSLASKAGDIM